MLFRSDLPMGVDWSRVDRRRSLLSLVDEKFRKMGEERISFVDADALPFEPAP